MFFPKDFSIQRLEVLFEDFKSLVMHPRPNSLHLHLYVLEEVESPRLLTALHPRKSPPIRCENGKWMQYRKCPLRNFIVPLLREKTPTFKIWTFLISPTISPLTSLTLFIQLRKKQLQPLITTSILIDQTHLEILDHRTSFSIFLRFFYYFYKYFKGFWAPKWDSVELSQVPCDLSDSVDSREPSSLPSLIFRTLVQNLEHKPRDILSLSHATGQTHPLMSMHWIEA